MTHDQRICHLMLNYQGWQIYNAHHGQQIDRMFRVLCGNTMSQHGLASYIPVKVDCIMCQVRLKAVPALVVYTAMNGGVT